MKILLLIGSSDFGKIVTNNLQKRHEIVGIVQEKPKNKYKLLKYRVKRLGVFTAVGQFVFIIYSKFLKRNSSKRINEILSVNNLSVNSIKHDNILMLNSINESKSEEFIKNNHFDVVIVTGTGIIKQNILKLINVPIINIHVGITPMYRGVHGAYWALVNNDIENCGVTLHLVDEGVDTGAILEQKHIQISSKDNFTTYPYLQFAEAVNCIDSVINRALNNEVFINKENASNQYYHPTIFQYLYYRLVKGVK